MAELFDDIARVVGSQIPRRRAVRLIASALAGSAVSLVWPRRTFASTCIERCDCPNPDGGRFACKYPSGYAFCIRDLRLRAKLRCDNDCVDGCNYCADRYCKDAPRLARAECKSDEDCRPNEFCKCSTCRCLPRDTTACQSDRDCATASTTTLTGCCGSKCCKGNDVCINLECCPNGRCNPSGMRPSQSV